MDNNRSLRLLVLISPFLLSSQGVKAMPKPAQFRVQNRDTVLGAKSFRSLKVVPDYVARIVPIGGKTKFYGEAEIKTGRKRVSILRVHFYEWKVSPSPDGDERSTGRCAVDIYLQSDRRDAFYLVSSIKDGTSGVNKSFGFPITFVNVMWLNNKIKTIPIVRFCCQSDGFYGRLGQNFFLTFARGLNQKPAVQNFENYSSHFDFVDWFFDGVDARGNRKFIQLIDPLGEGEDKYVFWNWSQKTLAFLSQKEGGA
jgi:hypothetical protein